MWTMSWSGRPWRHCRGEVHGIARTMDEARAHATRIGFPVLVRPSFVLGGRVTGVLAETHVGRPIKLEGNPLHPVNRGTLCIRGQAALQGLYNPDRLSSPMLRGADGFAAITWEEAEALLSEAAGGWFC